MLCSPGADPSESRTFTLQCSVPSSHQHAAVPAQHPCCNIAWEKCNPTVSLLPLGILPLGGQRGCLPSLPGHSTLSEPKTRKVLISPATDRRRNVSIPPKSSILNPPDVKCQVWGRGLLAFRNVPRHSSQEHFAGVNRVLVVSGRQLPAPGAGRFIHSWDKHKQHSVQTSNLPQVSRRIPVFHNRRFSRAAAATGSCPHTLPVLLSAAHTSCLFCCQQADPAAGWRTEKALICCKLTPSHVICTGATYVTSQKRRTITTHRRLLRPTSQLTRCLPMKPGFSFDTEGVFWRVQEIPGRPRRCSRPSF